MINCRCTAAQFTNPNERKRLRDGWLTRLFEPALYQVSVRNLAVLTIIAAGCYTDRAFIGFLPTIGRPHADQPPVGARPRLVL